MKTEELSQLSSLDQEMIENVSSAEMSPMQAMWARVHSKAAELDPDAARIDDEIRKSNPKHRHGYMEVSRKVIWLTSKKTPVKGLRGGRVFQVPPLLAARMIVDETHRISTEAEVAGWEADQVTRRKEQADLAALKAPPTPQVNVNISPETLASAMRDQTRRPAPDGKQQPQDSK